MRRQAFPDLCFHRNVDAPAPPESKTFNHEAVGGRDAMPTGGRAAKNLLPDVNTGIDSTDLRESLSSKETTGFFEPKRGSQPLLLLGLKLLDGDRRGEFEENVSVEERVNVRANSSISIDVI